jgi:hypothetical protein
MFVADFKFAPPPNTEKLASIAAASVLQSMTYRIFRTIE